MSKYQPQYTVPFSLLLHPAPPPAPPPPPPLHPSPSSPLPSPPLPSLLPFFARCTNGSSPRVGESDVGRSSQRRRPAAQGEGESRVGHFSAVCSYIFLHFGSSIRCNTIQFHSILWFHSIPQCGSMLILWFHSEILFHRTYGFPFPYPVPMMSMGSTRVHLTMNQSLFSSRKQGEWTYRHRRPLM